MILEVCEPMSESFGLLFPDRTVEEKEFFMTRFIRDEHKRRTEEVLKKLPKNTVKE